MCENDRVAAKIRQLREDKHLSLEELSERSELSAEWIAKIENGDMAPSLAPLLKIARGLGVRLGTFLDDSPAMGPAVVRGGQSREVVRFASATDGHVSGMVFRSLAPNKQDRHMEPFIVDVLPQADGERKLSTHEGEEFIYVLHGTLQIDYGKEQYSLQTGDSIYYDSIVPHAVYAGGENPTTILAVVFTPH